MQRQSGQLLLQVPELLLVFASETLVVLQVLLDLHLERTEGVGGLGAFVELRLDLIALLGLGVHEVLRLLHLGAHAISSLGVAGNLITQLFKLLVKPLELLLVLLERLLQFEDVLFSLVLGDFGFGGELRRELDLFLDAVDLAVLRSKLDTTRLQDPLLQALDIALDGLALFGEFGDLLFESSNLTIELCNARCIVRIGLAFGLELSNPPLCFGDTLLAALEVHADLVERDVDLRCTSTMPLDQGLDRLDRGDVTSQGVLECIAVALQTLKLLG